MGLLSVGAGRGAKAPCPCGRLSQLAAAVKQRRQTLRRRAEAIAAYGAVCACCGEDRFLLLSIDHVEGQGTPHRRSPTARPLGAGFWSRVLPLVARQRVPPWFPSAVRELPDREGGARSLPLPRSCHRRRGPGHPRGGVGAGRTRPVRVGHAMPSPLPRPVGPLTRRERRYSQLPRAAHVSNHSTDWPAAPVVVSSAGALTIPRGLGVGAPAR